MRRGPTWRAGGRSAISLLLGLIALATVCTSVTAPASSAATMPHWTTSYYEGNARVPVLFHQGAMAGRAGAQGIVILDFGRPATRAGVDGTIDFSGAFLPFAAIAAGARSFVHGYYRDAPRSTSMFVAIGTNNSCGTGQPCGSVLCGCVDEPASFLAWGEQLAAVVKEDAAWTIALRRAHAYTDDVQVVAADDIEPAFDPGFLNTDDVLAGYAAAVGGTSPAMVDYGSADPHFWPEEHLYQVAYGFPPDVPMPEIYDARQAREWATLLRYARQRGRTVTIFGVLSEPALGEPPASAYGELLRAITGITAQQKIPWLSAIAAFHGARLAQEAR